MLRLMFEKKGNAVWISHLDLMRVFQRAFKRAGLPLTHTQGFNPRPSVSIALPLSVGVESECELLDFELDSVTVPCEEICERLNAALIDGVHVRRVYEDGSKIKNLALLRSVLTLEYDSGIPCDTVEKIKALFSQSSVIVEKRGKNGITQQDIIPMLRELEVSQSDNCVALNLLACCQNPTLNPMQLAAAIERYLPEHKPDYVSCRRIALFDADKNEFQ